MPDIRGKFIESASRPVADNFELSLAARDFLEKRTEDVPEKKLADAVRRWERFDARPRRFNWRQVIIAAALVITPVFFFPVKSFRDQTQVFQSFGWFSKLAFPSTPAFKGNVFSKLDGNGRLLIGDPGWSEMERAEKLWETDRRNPAYFAEYAGAHWNQFKRLPPDYGGTAAELEPDNAWFDLFAASTAAEGAVERLTGKRKKGDPPEWRILDDAKLRRCLTLLGGLEGKSRIESHAEGMSRKRTAILPQSTPVEQLGSVAVLAERQCGYLGVYRVGNVIAVHARDLGDAGDVEGFRRFRDQFARWSVLLMESESTSLLDAIIMRSFVTCPLKNFRESETKLGLDHRESPIAGWEDAFEAMDAERKIRRKNPPATVDMIHEQGSLLCSLSLPMLVADLENPPPVSRDDLAPMRYSEYSVIARVSAVLLWVLLLLGMAMVFAHRYRAPVLVRMLALRTLALLRLSDWIWILGGGVMVPFFAVMALIVATPFGGRDVSLRWGIEKSTFIMPTGHFMMLFFLMILLVTLIGRWRLRCRARMFGFGGEDVPGWISVVLLVVAIAGALHLPARLPEHGFQVWMLAPCLWVAFTGLRALFGAKDRILQRLVVSHVLLVSLAVAVLCVAPMVWYFGHATQWWFEKDRFMKLTPEAPGMVPYEYKASRAFHEETRRIVR